MTTLALQSSTAAVKVQNVRFRRALASERVKLWSVRSTVLTLLAAVVAIVLIDCVAAWAFTSKWDDLDLAERAICNPIDPALVSVNLAQLAQRPRRPARLGARPASCRRARPPTSRRVNPHLNTSTSKPDRPSPTSTSTS